MTELEIDARLMALLSEPVPPADPAFADRIIALARHDLAVSHARRSAVNRVGIETLALAAILAVFAVLARSGPEAAGFGDTVALVNPAMIGLTMLGLWLAIGLRPATVGR